MYSKTFFITITFHSPVGITENSDAESSNGLNNCCQVRRKSSSGGSQYVTEVTVSHPGPQFALDKCNKRENAESDMYKYKVSQINKVFFWQGAWAFLILL